MAFLIAPLLGCGSCDEDDRGLLGFLLILSSGSSGLQRAPEDTLVVTPPEEDVVRTDDAAVPFVYDAGM